MASKIGWENINRVAKLKVLKYSYIVSFLYPLYVSSIEDAKKWVYSLDVNTHQIIFIYLSSLMMAAGVFLYDVFCPTIIKRHEKYDRYFNFLIENIKASRILQELQYEAKRDVIRNIDTSNNLTEEDISSVIDIIDKFLNKIIDDNSKETNTIVSGLDDFIHSKDHWEMENMRNPKIRFIIISLIYTSLCIYFFYFFIYKPYHIISLFYHT